MSSNSQQELSERLRSKSIGIRKMSEMDKGESGKVSFISLSHEEIEIMSQLGLEVGSEIFFDGEFRLQSTNRILKIDESLSSNIVLHLLN